jgi:hypothetical protein
MEHDPLADDEPLRDLNLRPVLMIDLHLSQLGSTLAFDEHGPLILLPEQGGQRHAQRILRLPNHYARLHAVSVSQPAPGFVRVNEIDQHIDALFFDSER